MAVTRTARGSATSKTSGTTLQIAAQSLNAGDLLVVYLAYDDQTLSSVFWGTQGLQLGDTVLGAGVRTRLAWCVADATASRTITATWASAIVAKAMVADSFRSSLTGGGRSWVADANSTNTGTGTAASTPATAAIVGGTESVRVGVVGTEGPSGDTAGTFAEPNTVSQRVGTTGNPAAGNVTVSSAYRIAPTAGSTTGLSKTGMTSRDWGAAIRSFYWDVPPTTSVAPSPVVAALDVPVPSVTADAGATTVNPDAVAATMATAVAAVSVGILVTPAACAVNVSTPVAAVSAGARVSPGPTSTALAVPIPSLTVGGSVSVSPAPAVATTATAVAAVSVGILVTPAVCAVNVSTPVAAVSAGARVSPGPVSTTLAVPIPSLTVGGSVSVSPAPVAATTASVAASVSVGVLVSPAACAVDVSTPVAVVSAGARIVPSPVALATDIPVPSLVIGSDGPHGPGPETQHVIAMRPRGRASHPIARGIPHG